MALDTELLMVNGRVRPIHLDDLYALFNGQSENAYAAVDLTTSKATLKTAIQALINATSLSGGDKTALYNDCAVAIDAEITNSYNVNKTAVFTEAKTQLMAAIVADTTNFANLDLRCAGSGRYAANKDPENASDDTTQIPCVSCDQFGYTSSANVPTTSWTVTTTF